MKRFHRVALVMGIVSLLAFASAQAGDWQKMGSTLLLFKTDADSIEVKKSDMDCSQIKFKVASKVIKVNDVKVMFDDGSMQEIELNERIKPGLESSVIDIDGGPKKITSVEFTYEPGDGQKNGRARVNLVAAS